MPPETVTNTQEGGATPPNAEGSETPTEGGAMPPEGQGTEGESHEGDGDEELGEAGKAALKKERDARRVAEGRAKDLENRIKELEAATAAGDKSKELDQATTEAEKWRTSYESLEGSFKAERIASRASEEAGKVGAIEPGVVAKLIQADKVVWDDERNPTNIGELVGAIKEAHPRLFSASPGNGNGGNRPARLVGDPGKGVDRLRSAYASKD